MAKKTLQEQANEILAQAERRGVSSNFFFVTTFNRYLVQLSILTELEKAIKEDGALVTKEYVKNRKNIYSNPAISEYNRTVDSANKTVATLMRILRNFNVGEDDKGEAEEDPLLRMINGSEADEGV